MYWGSSKTGTGEYAMIEMAFLNGSERTTLHRKFPPAFSGITLLNNSLYVSSGR